VTASTCSSERVARNASTAAVVFEMVSAVVVALEPVTSPDAWATVLVLVLVVPDAAEEEVVAPAAHPLSRSPPSRSMVVPARSFFRRGRFVVSV
jgi:hypothetical protein